MPPGKSWIFFPKIFRIWKVLENEFGTGKSWNLPLRCSGMARVFKGSHSFTCTRRVHPLTEWTIPAFGFPAKAGTHLPTPEGWKAELALEETTRAPHITWLNTIQRELRILHWIKQLTWLRTVLYGSRCLHMALRNRRGACQKWEAEL